MHVRASLCAAYMTLTARSECNWRGLPGLPLLRRLSASWQRTSFSHAAELNHGSGTKRRRGILATCDPVSTPRPGMESGRQAPPSYISRSTFHVVRNRGETQSWGKKCTSRHHETHALVPSDCGSLPHNHVPCGFERVRGLPLQIIRALRPSHDRKIFLTQTACARPAVSLHQPHCRVPLKRTPHQETALLFADGPNLQSNWQTHRQFLTDGFPIVRGRALHNVCVVHPL